MRTTTINNYTHVRLTQYQITTIKNIIHCVLGDDKQTTIWLFGSRVDLKQRGGDIDLFIETNAELENSVDTACLIYAKIIMALGDQKIDVLLKDNKTQECLIFETARRTGVIL
jgi:hypothetical protein